MRTAEEIVLYLKSVSDSKSLAGMQRFAIKTDHALGVSIPELRKLAKSIGVNHCLSLDLWKTAIHEARILAGMIDDPAQVTEKQMESWVYGFDSWDICDQTCMNLFRKTQFAYAKAIEWSGREEEYVKRAGFVLPACLAVHDKQADDHKFEQFFDIIVRESTDDRNFVKKAVNWALRQIGKRNISLNTRAVEVANQIKEIDSKSTKWIASDAIRELNSDSVRNRLLKKSN